MSQTGHFTCLSLVQALSVFRLLSEGVGESMVYPAVWHRRSQTSHQENTLAWAVRTLGSQEKEELGKSWLRKRLQIKLGHCCFKDLFSNAEQGAPM